MLILTVAKGPDRGAVFEVRDKSRAIIGRNSPDVPVTDLMVSRYHCRLKFEDGVWYLRDLGSRNGTRLNGERMQRTMKLKDGDLIGTGYTEMQVKLAVGAAPSRPESPAPTHLKLADDAGADSSGEIEAGSDSATLDLDSQPAKPAKAAPRAEDEHQLAAAPASVVAPAPLQLAPIDVDPPDPRDPPETDHVAGGESSVIEGALESMKDGLDEVAAASAPQPAAPPPIVEARQPEPPVKPSGKAGEVAATDWFDAVASQIVVAQEQGWESELVAEDEQAIRAANKNDVEVDEKVRSYLYYDEDEHWGEVDGDELPPHEDVEVKETSAEELAKLLDEPIESAGAKLSPAARAAAPVAPAAPAPMQRKTNGESAKPVPQPVAKHNGGRKRKRH